MRSLHAASVSTVEGLGRPKAMHPIQEAIVKSHASQCGFCTPGMVMSMSAKMRENRGVVDIEDVKRCVQGNLCRCTGYRPIIQGGNSIEKCWLAFGFKNHLSFGLRFPILQKRSKIESEAVFKPKLKSTFFLLNCLPGLRKTLQGRKRGS